jgi:hypothetical protein
MMLAMIAILLFAFRKQSAGQPRVTGVESSGPATILASLKARRLMLISLFLALCLPVPPPDGIPLGFFVVMSPVALFSDNGHLGPWYVPLIAGAPLAIYFSILFLLLSAVAWLVRKRARSASPS